MWLIYPYSSGLLHWHWASLIHYRIVSGVMNLMSCHISTVKNTHSAHNVCNFEEMVHWNGNVVILMKFSWLAVLEVLRTSSTASDEHFIKMTFPFDCKIHQSWWHHQMETFSVLLALCEGNPPVTGGFLSQRPVMRSFDVFFDLSLNKRLSKQPRCWWFELMSGSVWRHCN